jgi:hypothetical protein
VDPNAIYLSVITLGEIMKGISLKQRTDARACCMGSTANFRDPEAFDGLPWL